MVAVEEVHGEVEQEEAPELAEEALDMVKGVVGCCQKEAGTMNWQAYEQ